MAKTEEKKTGKKPKTMQPKRIQIAFRIDEATAAALEAKRQAMGVISFSLSDTVREMILRQLQAEAEK